MQHLLCRKCGRTLPKGCFYPSAKKRRMIWCKDCWNRWMRDWRRSKAGKAYDKRRDERRTAQRFEAIRMLGNRCENCGTEDVRVLQIHHRIGGGSAERSRGLDSVRLVRGILSGRISREKFGLLCANCNWIEYYRRTGLSALSLQAN